MVGVVLPHLPCEISEATFHKFNDFPSDSHGLSVHFDRFSGNVNLSSIKLAQSETQKFIDDWKARKATLDLNVSHRLLQTLKTVLT